MRQCEHCAGSGIYITYIPPMYTNSSDSFSAAVPCKHCKGKGWIDEDELFNNIPRKYIKDEYFK